MAINFAPLGRLQFNSYFSEAKENAPNKTSQATKDILTRQKSMIAFLNTL